METVFRIPELLNAILQNFLVLPRSDHQIRGVRPAHLSRDDLVSDKERRQTLYRMALTNRAISRIALPLLWNTIDGVSPLLKLVPGLDRNQLVEAWVLLRPLLAEDFDRLEIYARMVKHIEVPPKNNSPPHLHSSTFFEICLVRGTKPLCPSLRTLCVDECCDYAGILLTDKLKCLKIVRQDRRIPRHQPKPSVCNLLTLLPTRTPLLEELYIGSALSSSNLADILKLEHLQKLTFDLTSVTHWPVNEQGRYQFFKHLESLPELHELDIGNLLEDHRSRISPLLDPKATISYDFPALERLSLSGFDDYLRKVLIRSPGITLKSLLFRVEECIMWNGLNDEDEDEDDEDELQEIVDFDVCKAFPILGERHFHSLTKLEIDSSYQRFDPDDFEPLFRITGMQHFDFQYTGSRGVNDQLILRMASAWPQLEFFRLYIESFESPDSCPTLASIQTFARHCPNLRRLSMDLDPTVIRLNDFDTIYPLNQLTLFSLMEDSELGKHNVPAVASFLAECFPALIFAYIEFPRIEGQGPGSWPAVFRRLLQDRDSEELGVIRSLLKLRDFDD